MQWEEKKLLRGNYTCPIIDKNGDLAFIYENEDEGINLATRKMGRESYDVMNLSRDPYISYQAIKQDKSGKICTVCVQDKVKNNHIFLGSIKDNKIENLRILSDDTGFNFSTDLDFDSENNPWATWIRWSDGKFYVMVKNLALNKTWIVNYPFLVQASSPKIVIDGNKQVWVFWVGRGKGRDEIFYVIFDHIKWSVPYKLNNEILVPHILPDVCLNEAGFPMIVWTSYDESDYEIFYSSWNGKKWSKEEKITDNDETDSYPVISCISNHIPIILWSKSSGKINGIYCKYKSYGQWSEEIEIYRENLSLNIQPKMVTQDDKIGIIWQSNGIIKSKFLYFKQLQERNIDQIWKNNSMTILDPSRDDDEFIGFGDSITFGYLDYHEAPELGYIPRLEILLNNYFGPSKIINEGWPGEISINGLGRIENVINIHCSRYLLLMEGTNDVIFKEISMDTTAFDLEQMILTCEDYGVFPLLSTIIPRKDWRWDIPFYHERIFDLNDKIREIATDQKIPLTDQFNFFSYYPEEEGGWKSLLSTDGVHPSIKGYEFMAECWFKDIKILPFPPIIKNISRTSDDILFYSQKGNLLTWTNNPKLSDEDLFEYFKIYRSDEVTGKNYHFVLIAMPSFNITEYFDSHIIPSHDYTYTVSLISKSGIEGPCSKIKSDNR